MDINQAASIQSFSHYTAFVKFFCMYSLVVSVLYGDPDVRGSNNCHGN